MAGIGIAAAGSILAWHGYRGTTRVDVGPGRASLRHRITF
jgi:hypothetical protein